MSHPTELNDLHLLRECEVRRTRGSGPGGQHRNKVETAIVIEHKPSGIRSEATERRSQEANRSMAVERLRVLLAIGVRTERSLEQVPSERWRSRLSGGKLQVSASHADFPPLLAEALDCIAQHTFDVAAAAKQLT